MSGVADLSTNWSGQGGNFLFHCPGCDFAHVVHLGSGTVRWNWDGNRASPTFSPSLLYTIEASEGYPEVRCHSYIRSGRIQFLADCHHKLAGQTVPLEPWRSREEGERP